VSLIVDAHINRGNFSLDAELEVGSEEVLAVLGPNGSGKSTLLRTIAGLLPLDSGRIVLEGDTLDDPATNTFVNPERRSMGVMFQDYLLFPHLDVIENVAFALRARGTPKALARATATVWIQRLGLEGFGRSLPGELSGGQAQRVALARALVCEPRVLLLDEPLAALDASTRTSVRRDLRRYLADFGGARVLVTHDPIDAYALADRVVVIENGRVVQSGTLSSVTAHPRSRFVADLLGVNLVSGVVTGQLFVTSGGAEIVVADAEPGQSFAAIRPQAIVLARDPASTSARNSWHCTVGDIDRFGERARVTLTGLLPLIAEITTSALETLNLEPGDPVVASVKATDIRTYPV
jgi:molybdate transport system ATP-binding protein